MWEQALSEAEQVRTRGGGQGPLRLWSCSRAPWLLSGGMHVVEGRRLLRIFVFERECRGECWGEGGEGGRGGHLDFPAPLFPTTNSFNVAMTSAILAR